MVYEEWMEFLIMFFDLVFYRVSKFSEICRKVIKKFEKNMIEWCGEFLIGWLGVVGVKVNSLYKNFVDCWKGEWEWEC